MKKCWNDNENEKGNRYQKRKRKINVAMNTEIQRKWSQQK